MRNSARQFHQRMGKHNRRRRLMLSSYSQAAAPSFVEEEMNESILLDPDTMKTVNASADYLSQKEGEVDSVVGVANNFIRGRSATGSALLADFPEVECEVLPEDQPQTRHAADDDPESVFSDFGEAGSGEAGSEDSGSEDVTQGTGKPVEASGHEAAERKANQQQPVSAASTSLTGAFKDPAVSAAPQVFSREPMGATSGMNQIRSWLHGHEPRVWMFLGDETTAWMRYHHEPGYAEMFRHRLRWELRRFPDLIVNAGIESATVEELLKVADQGLRQCRADAVFVLPGPSDAHFAMQRPSAYAQKLLELATVIRKQGAAPVFQTPPIPFAEQQTEYGQQLVHLADVIRETCIVHEIPVIDHAEFWLEQPPCSSWYEAEQRTLTTEGQSALGLLFFSELDLFDRSSQLCTRLQDAWHGRSRTDEKLDQPPSTSSPAGVSSDAQ